MKTALLQFKQRFFPKSLFGRALIILMAPIVLVQLVSNFVFLDRHLDSVTKLLADNIVSMVKTLVYLQDHPNEAGSAPFIAQDLYGMDYTFTPGQKLSKQLPHPDTWAETYLTETLDSKLNLPYTLVYDDQHLILTVETPQGLVTTRFLRKRLMSKTTQLVFIWAIGISILSLIIAALFMRNQVKPLRHLAEKTEALGKGQDVPDTHPHGSREIRQVTLAFNVMKNRIKRQLTQRAEMLAGISHDLRTPLTRMKLELEMLPPSDVVAELKRDVKNMQNMIDAYLNFVRNDGQEKAVKIQLTDLIHRLVQMEKAQKKVAITYHTQPNPLHATLRPSAIERVLKNLLDNACRYATTIGVTASTDENYLTIIVDDDGIGIPKDKREAVFKAFYRIDTSRNPNTGGVGLGLSIVKDIVHQHGGKIWLEDAPIGGLRVNIRIPL